MIRKNTWQVCIKLDTFLKIAAALDLHLDLRVQSPKLHGISF